MKIKLHLFMNVLRFLICYIMALICSFMTIFCYLLRIKNGATIFNRLTKYILLRGFNITINYDLTFTPPDEKCLYIANHDNPADIFLLMNYPGISYLVNEKFPHIAPWIKTHIRLTGGIFINKSNKHSKANALRQCIRKAQDNNSLFLFPTGGFAKSIKNHLNKGYYLITKKTNATLIPVYINYEPKQKFLYLKKNRKKRLKAFVSYISKPNLIINITYGDPLFPCNYKDSNEMTVHIKKLFQKNLNDYQ